jgi:hypothetical protein
MWPVNNDSVLLSSVGSATCIILYEMIIVPDMFFCL